MRCDYKQALAIAQESVSIHTPTWGVTEIYDILVDREKFQSTHLHEVWQWIKITTKDYSKFQSTHLHEVWLIGLLSMVNEKEFQSTHLHEVWRYPNTYQKLPLCFNPHTYMRCDDDGRKHKRYSNSFNPHTYMRCDNKIAGVDTKGQVSIHTPTWGVTPQTTKRFNHLKFQSTHLHEVWLSEDWWHKTPGGFQSTHLHEVWLGDCSD